MKALRSATSSRGASKQIGLGTLAMAAVLFLFATSLVASAAGTTITLNAGGPYSANATINITGVVSPPSAATSVAVSVLNPSGVQVGADTASVNQTTGDYSYSFGSGGNGNWVAGNYTATAKFEDTSGNLYTATGTFSYAVTTTTTTTTNTTTTCSTCTTTIYATTTVVASTTTTVIQSTAITTTVVQPGPTTVQPVTTIVSSITTVSATSAASGVGTAEALGAVGIVIGIIAAVLAVMTMRKK